MAELRKGLSLRELEEEFARAVVSLGTEIGRNAFINGGEEPDGADLISRVARAHYNRLQKAKERREEEESDRALERQLDG